MFLKSKKFLCLGILVFALVGNAAEEKLKSPVTQPQLTVQLATPQVETLPNGLKIAWMANDRLPIVDLGFQVKLGPYYYPFSCSGMVDWLVGSLEQGAAGKTAAQIAHSIELLGGNRNISATEDSILISAHSLEADLPDLLDYLANIAIRPELPEEGVNLVRLGILDRWHHVDDYYELALGMAYHRHLSAGTPSERGVYNDPNEFKKLTRKQLVEFYQAHFRPENSVITVTGRFQQEIVRQKIHSLFGDWKGASVKKVSLSCPRLLRRHVTKKPLGVVILDRSAMAQALVKMGSPSISLNDPNYYSMRVANAVFGEMFNSRLGNFLRDKLGLTFAVHSNYSGSRNFSELTISTSATNESTGKLIQKTIEALNDFKKGKITPAELEAAKTHLTGSFAMSHSTLNSVMSRWLIGESLNLKPTYINDFIPGIQAVTLKEAEQAKAKVYDLANFTITVMGDAATIKKGLKEVGVKVLQVKK